MTNPLNTAWAKNTSHKLSGLWTFSACYKLLKITKTYWKQVIKIVIFLSGKNAKQIPSLKEAVMDVIAEGREGVDLKWLLYKYTS